MYASVTNLRFNFSYDMSGEKVGIGLHCWFVGLWFHGCGIYN